jgi:hypothetical protein
VRTDSAGGYIQVQNLAARAPGDDFDGTATDLAVGGKALICQARVHRHLKPLAAIRALNVHKFFHGTSLTEEPDRANTKIKAADIRPRREMDCPMQLGIKTTKAGIQKKRCLPYLNLFCSVSAI